MFLVCVDREICGGGESLCRDHLEAERYLSLSVFVCASIFPVQRPRAAARGVCCDLSPASSYLSPRCPESRLPTLVFVMLQYMLV